MIGKDAIGRLAIGQLSASANVSVTVSGAAGIGLSGALTATSADLLIGVAGGGAAGAFSDIVVYSLSGVAAAGSSGIITPNVLRPFTGVGGAGAAGVAAMLLSDGLTGVAGAGLVGSLRLSSSAPTLIGVSGTGVAGSLLPALSVSSLPIGVSGIGIAGRIAIVVSGGGGTSELVRRNPRMRTGFEPVKKIYRAPEPISSEPRIRPPPLSLVRAPAPRPTPLPTQPPPLVDQRLMPDVSALIQKITEAEAASRRQRQDEQDIAELLAFLDSQEKT